MNYFDEKGMYTVALFALGAVAVLLLAATLYLGHTLDACQEAVDHGERMINLARDGFRALSYSDMHAADKVASEIRDVKPVYDAAVESCR